MSFQLSFAFFEDSAASATPFGKTEAAAQPEQTGTGPEPATKQCQFRLPLWTENWFNAAVENGA